MPLPIPQAAKILGVHPATLKRWISRGAPVARRGRRGRGGRTLVDVDQVRQWQKGGDAEAVLYRLAADVPHLLADAMAQAHRLAEGPYKRELGQGLCGAWYLANAAIADRLRNEIPNIQEPTDLPPAIAQMAHATRLLKR